MSRHAAIFDLDRTLLSGASGTVFAKSMRSAGLIGPAMPGESLLGSIFSTFGENLPMMGLGRALVGKAKGTSRAATIAAAEEAADTLVGLLQPFAASLFAEHRAAGRLLVLATTTPRDLVSPLADRLGFDAVVATQYGFDSNDTYTGAVDGHYVWSKGKRDAVTEWAAAEDVDLAESWFYSDSVYDAPLMMAVGHPVVVNPDARMALLATARRWPTLHLDVPAGVPKLPIVQAEPQAIARLFLRPELMPFVRFDIEGVSRIPADGPAIVIANHRSYFDVAAMAMTLASSGRNIRFLGKKEVFDAPIVGPIARAMGGIRVERGSGSDAPLQAAEQALAAGEIVAIMPQGTIPRGEAFYAPGLSFRPGAARLAAATKAPVIPVGLWGTEAVWPRNSKVPQIWNIAAPPTVWARVGEPVELKYRSAAADSKRLAQAVLDLLPDSARQPYQPSAAEIRRATP